MPLPSPGVDFRALPLMRATVPSFNRVMRRRGAVALPVGTLSLTLTDGPVREDVTRFGLTAGAARLIVGVTPALLHRLTAGETDPSMLELALDAILTGLEGLIGQPLTLAPETGADLPFQRSLRCDCGPVEGGVVLAFGAGAVPMLADLLDRLPLAPPLAIDPSIRLHLRLGRYGTTQDVVAGLMAGDCFVPDPSDLALTACDLMLRDRRIARGKIAGATFEIEETEHMTDLADDTDTPLSRLGDLPVEIGFRLGPIASSHAALADLGAGQLIELGAPVDEARVEITANGSPIGHGRLVTVGGHMAVEIRRLADDA
ncbi:MAG: FliM/FliN family flagellar motor switch protein [Pseudomonadota bacterium]